MPLKTYGIFTAYSPGIEFRYEGLGRYLATFIKHGTKKEDTRFLLACPSWSRQGLRNLFDDAGIDPKSYKFVGPAHQPLLISLYEKSRRFRLGGRQATLRASLLTPIANHFAWAVKLLSVTRNPFTFVLIAAHLGMFSLLSLAFGSLGLIAQFIRHAFKRSAALVAPTIRSGITRCTDLLYRVLRIAPNVSFEAWLFASMHRHEVDALITELKACKEVIAWYCPTAMWPAVAKAGVPTLICVPDVVLVEFPVEFSIMGGEPVFEVYNGIMSTLNQDAAFVTYSDRTKNDILVEEFGVAPDQISVIRHAPNRLDQLIEVTGFGDSAAASRAYCMTLLATALPKAIGAYPRDFHGTDFRFLFYASQLRPSKNILQLLRAYRFLLKECYFGRKLILTGNPQNYSAIGAFVQAHGLENDVLFLPSLSDPQLAAFYRLADLAVNPSLSEGGMPFTFSEAVSVGTPIVMSDIAVTREVLIDEELRELTLFDPYDWRSIASTIERALADRQMLYDLQRSFFDKHLAPRTWDDVVVEHLAIMDELGKRGPKAKNTE